MTVQITYEGDLRTECIHLQSGSKIATDAPTDNQGKGEHFSPTDLVATALASCILTTMGIKAQDMHIDLKGTQADVTKIMTSSPRKIGEIKIVIHFPKLDLEEKQKIILERIAHTCPVAQSISSEVVHNVIFEW